MYINTLKISDRGQIVLPKKVRDKLKSRTISIELNEDNQIIISAVHDLGGALSGYQKSTPLSFKEIRNQAWKDSLSMNQGHQ